MSRNRLIENMFHKFQKPKMWNSLEPNISFKQNPDNTKKNIGKPAKLTVAAEGEGVVPLPGCPTGWPSLVVQVTLSSQTPVFLSCRSEPTEFSVLVDRITDPVDPRVISDGSMCRINQDYLKVLVS